MKQLAFENAFYFHVKFHTQHRGVRATLRWVSCNVCIFRDARTL